MARDVVWGAGGPWVIESQDVVEIREVLRVDNRVDHCASCREFSLPGEDDTEVFVTIASPEWI
jgi:hypothetical protein